MEETTATLDKALKKSFRTMKRVQTEWQITQSNSYPYIDSLLNLSEQLECCEQGCFDLELRSEFPDLKQRLSYKIIKAMEGKMQRLHNLLDKFKSLKDDVDKTKKSTFQVYQERASDLDIEYLTRGTPTSPPVASLLEWLTDISWWFTALYEQKKDLLEFVCYTDNAYLQSLPQKWKDETCLYRMKGIMDQVALFLSAS